MVTNDIPLIILRSVKLIEMKQIKLDIDISEFIELIDFKSDEKENENLQINLKFPQVLMSRELGEDMVEISKNGGRN